MNLHFTNWTKTVFLEVFDDAATANQKKKKNNKHGVFVDCRRAQRKDQR